MYKVRVSLEKLRTCVQSSTKWAIIENSRFFKFDWSSSDFRASNLAFKPYIYELLTCSFQIHSFLRPVYILSSFAALGAVSLKASCYLWTMVCHSFVTSFYNAKKQSSMWCHLLDIKQNFIDNQSSPWAEPDGIIHTS